MSYIVREYRCSNCEYTAPRFELRDRSYLPPVCPICQVQTHAVPSGPAGKVK